MQPREDILKVLENTKEFNKLAKDLDAKEDKVEDLDRMRTLLRGGVNILSNRGRCLADIVRANEFQIIQDMKPKRLTRYLEHYDKVLFEGCIYAWKTYESSECLFMVINNDLRQNNSKIKSYNWLLMEIMKIDFEVPKRRKRESDKSFSARKRARRKRLRDNADNFFRGLLFSVSYDGETIQDAITLGDENDSILSSVLVDVQSSFL